MRLETSRIRLDGDTQPRAALRVDVIDDYTERMQAGAAFDPVTVYFDGTDYWLADGYHRLAAARRAFPDQPIEADVCEGTLADAQWFSYGANQNHGLRRTNEDKERAVRNALQHPHAEQMSNGEIAAHCGVSNETVRRYRTAMESTSKICKSTKRRGRDGRRINTSNIGKSRALQARKPRSPAELLEARRNGYRGRPTCMVKLELPNNHVQNCAYDLLERFTFEYLQKVFTEIVRIQKERSQKEGAQ